MSVLFERIAILGLGLLGGSVALAAKERGVAREVIGWGRREAALEEAKRRGVVDAFTLNAEEAVKGADLVLLAVPVDSMPALLAQVAAQLEPGALVTDVGSVKGELGRVLPSLLPAGARYIGSHPMAGSHLRGVEYADADLFQGAACMVGSQADAEAQARITAFWRALGGRVMLLAPEVHDIDVAWVSHLPHLISFAFAQALEDAPGGCLELAGSGFADFTRIAKSDPSMWSEILVSNREALAGPLQKMRVLLDRFAEELEGGDAEGIRARIESGQRVFDNLS